MANVNADSLAHVFSIEFWFDTDGATPKRKAILTTIAECQETAMLQAERLLSVHEKFRDWGKPDTWFCLDGGAVDATKAAE